MTATSTGTQRAPDPFCDVVYRQQGVSAPHQPLELPVKINPSTNGKLVVNYPGWNGDIDGYNNKYATLANHVAEQIAGVVRAGNIWHQELDYSESVVDDLREIIKYSIKNAGKICGSKNPEIYLMGFSAGASAIAALAHEFPEVTRILLMAPSGDAGQEAVTNGLSKFKGRVSIVVGENDEVVGVEAADKFGKLATAASDLQVCKIPACDHQFRGALNGRIMSAAPLWAFLDDVNELEASRGIWLYD